MKEAPENFDWSRKCTQVGCREYGVAAYEEELYCGKHFNNLQRLACINRGCKHPIPEMD